MGMKRILFLTGEIDEVDEVIRSLRKILSNSKIYVIGSKSVAEKLAEYGETVLVDEFHSEFLEKFDTAIIVLSKRYLRKKILRKEFNLPEIAEQVIKSGLEAFIIVLD